MSWYSSDTDTSYTDYDNYTDATDYSDYFDDGYGYTDGSDDTSLWDTYEGSDDSDSYYQDLEITDETISDVLSIDDPDFEDYIASLDSSDAIAEELAALSYEAGEYTDALGYYLVSKIDTVMDAVGSKVGSVFSSSLSSTIIQAASVSNPYVAIGIAVIGYIVVNLGVDYITDEISASIQDGILSGETSAADVSTLLNTLSEGDSDSFYTYLDTASAEEITDLISSGGLTLEDYTTTRSNSVYRRRTNIIGTGLNGLTIE